MGVLNKIRVTSRGKRKGRRVEAKTMEVGMAAGVFSAPREDCDQSLAVAWKRLMSSTQSVNCNFVCSTTFPPHNANPPGRFPFSSPRAPHTPFCASFPLQQRHATISHRNPDHMGH